LARNGNGNGRDDDDGNGINVRNPDLENSHHTGCARKLQTGRHRHETRTQ
jgi:hypothetical protein